MQQRQSETENIKCFARWIPEFYYVTPVPFFEPGILLCHPRSVLQARNFIMPAPCRSSSPLFIIPPPFRPSSSLFIIAPRCGRRGHRGRGGGGGRWGATSKHAHWAASGGCTDTSQDGSGVLPAVVAQHLLEENVNVRRRRRREVLPRRRSRRRRMRRRRMRRRRRRRRRRRSRRGRRRRRRRS